MKSQYIVRIPKFYKVVLSIISPEMTRSRFNREKGAANEQEKRFLGLYPLWEEGAKSCDEGLPKKNEWRYS